MTVVNKGDNNTMVGKHPHGHMLTATGDVNIEITQQRQQITHVVAVKQRPARAEMSAGAMQRRGAAPLQIIDRTQPGAVERAPGAVVSACGRVLTAGRTASGAFKTAVATTTCSFSWAC